MNTILKLENISKSFGGLVAVKDLNMEVNPFEILGIIGPNGAGKSTVLNIICGFYPPTIGSVFFEGQDITRLKAHERAGLGIARNFQSSVLFMDLPVIDNVLISCHLGYKTSIWKQILRLPDAFKEESALRQRCEEILEKMGLGPVKNEIAKNLPHGYQRILGICIALATKPKLILLDEPMTGMNRNEIQTTMKLIQDLRDAGITICMIEHNMEAVMILCDRILVLEYGKKIAEGCPKEIAQNERVIEAYLGKE